jgi:4'-phosphopantetheinyl transferase
MEMVMVYVAKYDMLPDRPKGSWYTEQGRKLLEYAFKEVTGNPIAPQIGIHSGGKPYLKNSTLHFNISHSGRYVVCALGGKAVGIDIQYHLKRDMEKVARRILNDKEWDAYGSTDDKMRFFYDRWSEKESYLKYTGEGIRSDMRKLFMDGILCHIEVDEEYSCCLCTGEECLYEVRTFCPST